MNFYELYHFHKSYIEHEDNLTNQRLSWLLAVTPVLLTLEAALIGLIFVLQSGAYSVSPFTFSILPLVALFVLATVTALCGAFLSAAAFMAIRGAAVSIDDAFDNFYKMVKPVDPSEVLPNVPQLTHGFGKVQKPRHLYPLAIVSTVCVAWAMAAALVILLAISPVTITSLHS